MTKKKCDGQTDGRTNRWTERVKGSKKVSITLKLQTEYYVLITISLIFRCVRQECIQIRGSVRLSVGRSVPRCAWAKTAFLGCFWPQWDPILNQMIDKHDLIASFSTLTFHLSVRPSFTPHVRDTEAFKMLFLCCPCSPVRNIKQSNLRKHEQITSTYTTAKRSNLRKHQWITNTYSKPQRSNLCKHEWISFIYKKA